MSIRRLLASTAALTAPLLLAACGGGGGGGGGLGVNTPLDQVTFLQIYNSSNTYLSRSAGGGFQSTISSPNTTNRVTVGANYSQFRVQAETVSSFTAPGSMDRTFTAGDLVATVGDTRVYQNTDGTLDYEWQVRLPGRDADALPEHVAFGRWTRSDPVAGNRDTGFLVFGQVAPGTDVPAAGTATYTGVAEGVRDRAGFAPDALTGTSTVAVNFGTGDANLTIDFTGSPFGATITGTSNNVTAGSSVFSGTAAGGGYSGSFTANFFGRTDAGIDGPEEVGGVFRLINATDFVYGGFAGEQ